MSDVYTYRLVFNMLLQRNITLKFAFYEKSIEIFIILHPILIGGSF